MIHWFMKHLSKVDKVEILRRIPLFSELEEQDLRLLASETKLIEYKKGDFIYREGDPADCFYAIVSGRIKVFTIQGGEEKVFAYLYEGNYFGELSLLTGEPHSVHVTVQNDALLLRLEKESFDKIIKRCPQVSVHISRLLSNRLKQKDREGEKIKTSKMISLYSVVPKVGKTLFAVNLAASLSLETDRKTILIDAAGGENNALSLLKVGENQRLDLKQADTSIAEVVQRHVTTHSTGFHVLGLVSDALREKEDKKIMALLSHLIFSYDFILFDLPVIESGSIQSILNQSDLIHLVTDRDEEHLLQTRQMAETLFPSKETQQRIRLVVNEKKGDFFASSSPTGSVSEGKGTYTLAYTPFLFSDLIEKGTPFIVGNPSTPYSKTTRYVAREIGDVLVGLALGSGAALGLAHVGVLKVLVREKIPIDVVSGSSIGAVVASAWASGKSPEEMERIVEKLSNRAKTFSLLADFDLLWVRGFFKGQKVMQFLKEIVGNRTFQEAMFPLKIVAGDLATRSEIIIEEGRLIDALRASISIPGILQPLIHEDQIIIDGAVFSPVPIECLRLAGAKKIIAVNVLPSPEAVMAKRKRLEEAEQKKMATILKKNFFIRWLYQVRKRMRRLFVPNIFDIMMQSMQTMEHQVSEVACRHADIVIRPTNISADWFEFFDAKKFIRRGEEETEKHIHEIKQLVFEQKRSASLTA